MLVVGYAFIFMHVLMHDNLFCLQLLCADSKPSDIIRFYGENIENHSLYDSNHKWKGTWLQQHLQWYQCDGGLFLKTGINFVSFLRKCALTYSLVTLIVGLPWLTMSPNQVAILNMVGRP